MSSVITFFRSIFAPPRHLILVLAALWIGLALAEKRTERHGISKEALNNIAYYSILGYIIGGRVIFALVNISTFVQSPLSIFSLNVDLFDYIGALATALIVGFVYGQRKGLPLWTTLDSLTPLFATLTIGLSLSHLAAGTAFGKPTNLPWGIDLWNATRHPSQIYELMAALFIFVMLWVRKTDFPPGSEFLLFVALTAGARLFLEAFRGDSTVIFGSIRQAQVLAWLVLAAALMASEFLLHKKRPIKQNPPLSSREADRHLSTP
jgi:phosphatidylglycerol:prolipoprotein diacylglycerol transferase